MIERSLERKIELRTIDPRSQLIILILINIIGMTNRSPRMEIVSITVIVLLMIWQGQGKKCFKFMLAYSMAWFLIFSTMLWPITFTGILAMIGAMGRKMIPVIMFATSIIATTKVGRLIAVLQEIRVPKGIIIGLAIAMRFFPTLKEEGNVVINSMKMRGISFNMKGIATHPILILENVLVPIMMRMTIIADELSVSSITRGIDSERKRTSYYRNIFTVVDVLLVLLFVGMALMAFMEVI